MSNEEDFLIELKNNIKQLKKELTQKRINNTKNIIKRSGLLTKSTIKLILPYVTAASITFGIFKLLGGTPLIRDKVKFPLHIREEIDSLGNTTYYEQYEEFTSEENILYIYSDWKETNNGLYERTIKEYQVKYLTIDEIVGIINNLPDIELKDILKEPTKEMTEKRNKLTEEEIKNNYKKAIIYSIDTNDYILVKEDTNKNIEQTIPYIALMIIEILGIIAKTEEKCKYKEEIIKIINDYEIEDLEILKRKLEINKNNYKRLK